jgi:uncharacterized membrane protein YcaP (DUF421 family)
MWNIGVPWWELVTRGLIVYVFLLVLLRISGKRQVGQLAPFDLVLLLVLSNAVQNSMNAGDNSLIGGLISATTLVGANFLVGMATAKLTHHELNAALRRAGCTGVEEVHSAILENNGSISFVPRNAARGSQSAGKSENT